MKIIKKPTYYEIWEEVKPNQYKVVLKTTNKHFWRTNLEQFRRVYKNKKFTIHIRK